MTRASGTSRWRHSGADLARLDSGRETRVLAAGCSWAGSARGGPRRVGRVFPVQPGDGMPGQVRLDGRPHGRVEARVAEPLVKPVVLEPVSYTHLTLPTIYS